MPGLPIVEYAELGTVRAASFARENETHKKAMTGGSFKLNMAPKSYFDENPFKSDKPLPPARKTSDKKIEVKPFKPSSPSKREGGMKAGTFDPYPSHSADPYRVKGSRDASAVNKSGKTYFPPPGPKSAPSTSVLDQNIVRAINVQNFTTIQSVMSY